MAVALAPITDADLSAVADFLHANLNARVPAATWRQAMTVPWKVDAPNHGFMITEEGSITGVYLAFYSEREIAGQRERFCNLGAWCVLPEYRLHSLRLLKALLAQPGYHFTDLSPSGSVVPLNTRLKFRSLDTATAVIPNLPWPSVSGGLRISPKPAVIERTLKDKDLAVYHDHERTAAARHLVLTKDSEYCYVMFRKVTRKQLPVFAAILYVSNPDLLARAIRPLSRHLLVRQGAVATLAELRIVRRRPPLSFPLPSARPKMYLSHSLEPEQIDDLYSELTCLPW